MRWLQSRRNKQSRPDRSTLPIPYCRASRAPSAHWSTAEVSSDSCEEIGENRPTLPGPSPVSFRRRSTACPHLASRDPSASPRTQPQASARQPRLLLWACGLADVDAKSAKCRREGNRPWPLVGGFAWSNHAARTTNPGATRRH